MISKIIVPTDFSPPAEQALKYAIELAKKTKAAIILLHINQVAMVDASMPAETYQYLVKEIEEMTVEGLDKLSKNLLIPSGVSFTTETKYGFVAEEICQLAKNEEADLIIMGTTGASGVAEILIGSNAASVVANSTVPILVIPKDLTYKDYGRIVYATDYNEPEFPALMRLIYFAELFDCPLDVVHVKSDADKYFNSENNFFKKNKANITYPNIQYIQLEKGDIIQSINHYVEENNADLLVMAKHNRGFFDRLFHRSLSKKMAYHTKIPLLVLVKE